MFFNRKSQPQQNESEELDIYKDYIRWVESGVDETFLDVDTSELIERRDSIEESIIKGEYTKEDLKAIHDADNLFRRKAQKSIQHYQDLINEGARGSDYLEGVLRQIQYPNMSNKDKWWYHLGDGFIKKYIHPRFDSFDVIASWDEEAGRWAKQLSVHIIDASKRAKKMPWQRDPREVGEVFYAIVCSPAFLKNPNGELTADDMKKALVMEVFSEIEVGSLLKKKIDTIGLVTLVEFEKAFEKHFGMSDWNSGE